MLFNIELSAWSILIIWLTLRKKKAAHYLADSQRNIGIYK